MPVLSVGLGFGNLPSPLPELPFAEAFVLPPGASSEHLVPAAYGLLHMDAVMAEKRPQRRRRRQRRPARRSGRAAAPEKFRWQRGRQ